jgi:SSS family solute:Na+ symporter
MDLAFLAPIGFSAPSQDPKENGMYVIPFLDRMGIVFVFCVVMMVLISLLETSRGVQPKGLEVDSSMFRPHRSFAIGSAVIIVLLTALYTVYW